MIVGNGDVASVLVDRKDLLFFAAGVSNSREDREEEYWRETQLLLKQDRNKHLVYFSSLAVFSSDTRYFQHKRKMESLIKECWERYAIVRIGNISWGKNPHTLINYLRAHPKAEIQDAYRYIVDREEFLYWIGMIPKWSCEMNIPGRRMKVQEVAQQYV